MAAQHATAIKPILVPGSLEDAGRLLLISIYCGVSCSVGRLSHILDRLLLISTYCAVSCSIGRLLSHILDRRHLGPQS